MLCSGYPTQLVIASVLAWFGIGPAPDGALSPTFILAISGIDSVLLLGLIVLFLKLSNDRPADVFLGPRPVSREIGLGLLTVPALLLMVVTVQLGVRVIAPYLHNVPASPFASLLESPWLVAGFIALLVIAGGIREELQRAFLLHRFEQRLGGGAIGLVATSAAFGLGHTMQGWDAALATGLLGIFWGAIYLTRRGCVATVTSHALFNITQVLVGYAATVRA